jgi:hypothetical protein
VDDVADAGGASGLTAVSRLTSGPNRNDDRLFLWLGYRCNGNSKIHHRSSDNLVATWVDVDLNSTLYASFELGMEMELPTLTTTLR